MNKKNPWFTLDQMLIVGVACLVITAVALFSLQTPTNLVLAIIWSFAFSAICVPLSIFNGKVFREGKELGPIWRKWFVVFLGTLSPALIISNSLYTGMPEMSGLEILFYIPLTLIGFVVWLGGILTISAGTTRV